MEFLEIDLMLALLIILPPIIDYNLFSDKYFLTHIAGFHDDY